MIQNIQYQELILLETHMGEEEHLDNFTHSNVMCQVAKSTDSP